MNIQPLHSTAAPQPIQPSPSPAAKSPEPPAAKPPVYDQYIPEEAGPQPASGLYRVAHDQDGLPRIEFDDPEAKAETTTCDTDQVDRELEALREKAERLEQQLRAAPEDRARELEDQLAQVRRELQQKDNDAYRRQHAKFS